MMYSYLQGEQSISAMWRTDPWPEIKNHQSLPNFCLKPPGDNDEKGIHRAMMYSYLRGEQSIAARWDRSLARDKKSPVTAGFLSPAAGDNEK
jgi:hypothetical protein